MRGCNSQSRALVWELRNSLRANSQKPNLATHQGLLEAGFASVCLAVWHSASVLVREVASGVSSCARILRSAFLLGEGGERAFFVCGVQS